MSGAKEEGSRAPSIYDEALHTLGVARDQEALSFRLKLIALHSVCVTWRLIVDEYSAVMGDVMMSRRIFG